MSFLKSLDISSGIFVVKGINLSVLKCQSFAIKHTSKIISENFDEDAIKDELKEELKALI